MGNYYCQIAGLPDVAFDGSKVNYSIDKLREELYPQLTSADAKLVDLFFLAWDNTNILTLLKYGSEAPLERTGCYSRQELLDIIASAKEGDTRNAKIPGYIYDFLEYYFAKEETGETIMWSDVISGHYYHYATNVPNQFLSQWFTFNMDLNNILVALLARKYRLNVAECVVGDNEIAEALRTSGAKDFGLTGTVDYLDTVVRLSENDRMQEREHKIDEMRWQWLDDNSVFYYFTVEKIYIFLQKLDIIERWMHLDAEKGMQRYNELIEGLKGGAVFTDILKK